jgi:hypothetical protein
MRTVLVTQAEGSGLWFRLPAHRTSLQHVMEKPAARTIIVQRPVAMYISPRRRVDALRLRRLGHALL